MKKLIIFYILICSLTIQACADGSADVRYPVYLDLSEPDVESDVVDDKTYDNLKIDTKKQNKLPEYYKLNIKKDNVIPDISSFENIKKSDKIKNMNFSKKISTKKEKKLGKKSALGVQYDTDIKPDISSQSRTIYTKHNITDKMSIMSSYKTNPMANMSEQLKGTMSFAPEFKLTERASLKSVYSKNLSGGSSSGEFQFRYNPFKDNRFDMNIGAGQTIYEDSRETSTKVNFGTNINF